MFSPGYKRNKQVWSGRGKRRSRGNTGKKRRERERGRRGRGRMRTATGRRERGTTGTGRDRRDTITRTGQKGDTTGETNTGTGENWGTKKGEVRSHAPQTKRISLYHPTLKPLHEVLFYKWFSFICLQFLFFFSHNTTGLLLLLLNMSCG